MEKRTDLRELDLKIAKLLGYLRFEGALVTFGTKDLRILGREAPTFYNPETGEKFDVPYYSTNPAHMLELIAEMRQQGWTVLIIKYPDKVVVNIMRFGSYEQTHKGEATTMPEAVARAAEAALIAEKGAGE